MKIAKLEEIHINMKNGTGNVEINGEDVSANVVYMSLEFKNGEWYLSVTEDELYSTEEQEMTSVQGGE